ncbi:hypothetical protein D3C72_2131890 [compost metagenome]
MKQRRIGGDEPVERTYALETFAGVVDGLVHAIRAKSQDLDRLLELFGAHPLEIVGEGPARPEGVAHACCSTSPSVASAWLE